MTRNHYKGRRRPHTERKTLVWRPEATGSDKKGENVYTEWEDVYRAIERERSSGLILLEFDSRFSSLNTPTGKGMRIPAGTWDMAGVTWSSQWGAFGDNPGGSDPTVLFEDLAFIDNLSSIDFPFGYLYHDGELHTPIRGTLHLSGTHVELYNTSVLAKPIVEAAGGLFVFVMHEGVVGSRNSPAPVVNGGDSFCIIACEGGEFYDNSFTQEGGFTRFLISAHGAQGPHQWNMPGLTSWEIVLVGTHGESWRNMSEVRTTVSGIAKYNQIELVDSSIGGFHLEFPTASGVVGETITVVGIGGGINAVTISGTGADVIDNPTISGSERKTWAPDGKGTWRHISS